MTEGQALRQAATALTPDILAVRDRMDHDRALPPPLVDKLRRAGLFHLWLPRVLGGPELHPADFLSVIEALSCADGSVGWCATNASVLSLLAGSMDESAAHDIFGQRAIAAGAANPMGKAIAVSGGYRVTGRWPYGSGIMHSTWLGANSVIHDGDNPRLNAAGTPVVRFMFFPRSAVEIIDAWNVIGLRGTGSHDYSVADVFVPESHTAPAFVVAAEQPGTLYRVPPLSLFTVALASVTLGIARAAIDALVELAAVKTPMRTGALLRDLGSVQTQVARAEAMWRAARAGVLEAIHAQWAATENGTADTMPTRAATRLACTWCAEACASAVDLVHAAAGGSAIQESGRIARCFRDIHAATQHIGIALANYEPCGRVLLGLDPGTPRF
ncbi:MAG: acyl-CoA dehydrogenase family protein [Acetobacteraceae bacterium]